MAAANTVRAPNAVGGPASSDERDRELKKVGGQRQLERRAEWLPISAGDRRKRSRAIPPSIDSMFSMNRRPRRFSGTMR